MPPVSIDRFFSFCARCSAWTVSQVCTHVVYSGVVKRLLEEYRRPDLLDMRCPELLVTLCAELTLAEDRSDGWFATTGCEK